MDFSENVYICIDESPYATCSDSPRSPQVRLATEAVLPENPSSSKQKRSTAAPKKKRRRRKLNMTKTLEMYKNRILNGPLFHQLHELDNSYLSTFQIFSTEKRVRKLHTNNAFVLMDICREQGYCVHGVTSECKVGGEYRAPLLEDHTRETHRVVYVGNYNYFTQHPESKWSLKPPDKIYSGYV